MVRRISRKTLAGTCVVAIALSSGLAGALACSSSSSSAPPAQVIDSGGSPTGTTAKQDVFHAQALPGCGVGAGTQSVVAVSTGGGKVAFASLGQTATTSPCDIDAGGADAGSGVPVWNICYAESASPGVFSTALVTSQPYLAPTGVGLALDDAGTPTIAYTGGPAAALRCGASQLFVTSRVSASGADGGGFGPGTQLTSTTNNATLLPCQASNCSAEDECHSGDATGFWPAIAVDSTGKNVLVYRFIHFGFATDDFRFSDVEYQHAGDPTLDIDVSRGGGTYTRLLLMASGRVAVLHYAAAESSSPSLWIDLQTGDESDAGCGGWSSQRLAQGALGEQLGFAVNGSGTMAAAYYDVQMARLVYTESPDGATWTPFSDIDLQGSTGFYPSLAFDPDGDPAIAYYKCNAVGAANANCNAADDGLFLARRKNGKWVTESVQSDTNVMDGLYPALTFVNGKAVIAYQTRAFDQASASTSVNWWVTEEQ